MDTATLPLLALAGLGALHGINPGMGWLFAVSLGLQRQQRRAVWASLGPLALGHAMAIAAALVAMTLIEGVIPAGLLRPFIAVLLVGMGIHRLVRHRHFRFGGMQVSGRQLTIWSFLMATGHGAGLMVLPLLTGGPAGGPAGGHLHDKMQLAGVGTMPDGTALTATLLHTAGYLLVTGVVALLVYEKLGLRLLRKAWINVDLLWSIALIVTGALVVIK